MRTIASCPICDTPWTTMRAVKGCPACGIPLNAETQSIRQAVPSMAALIAVGVVLFVFAAAERPFGRWEPAQILLLSVSVLVTATVMATRRRRAVLWDGGFVLLGRNKTPERFFWNQAATVEWGPSGERLELRRADGELVVSIGVSFFGTHRRAERFRTCAVAMLAK